MRAQHLVRLLLTTFCLSWFLYVTQGLHAQFQKPILIDGTSVVLRASRFPQTAHIVAPAASRATIQSATFTVTYSNFPADARAAFQRAVDIWASELSSTVPVAIDARWKPMEDSVLGSARSEAYVLNTTTNSYTPVALANSIAGEDLDPSRVDITAEFNSDIPSWYFGTDGNAAAGEYDLTTVVLHEIGHGLGFAGSMSVANGSGAWGANGRPLGFDRFGVNGAGQQLINTSLFPNPSAALATQLTSNNVFFNGANAIAAAGGTRPRLFAPTDWRSGSSFSHLDEDAFPIGSVNALMTPILDDGEVVHNVGPIVRGVFLDIGWKMSSQLPVNTATTAARTATTGQATTTVPVGSTATVTPSRTATTGAGTIRRTFLPIIRQSSSVNTSPTAVTTTPSSIATLAATATATSSGTVSATRAATQATGTATTIATAAGSQTPSRTSTTSASQTATGTATPTASASPTSTPSRTPSSTRTATPTRIPTFTATMEGT